MMSRGLDAQGMFKNTFLAQSAHPFVCLVHLLFKAAALVWCALLSYLFLNILLDNSILTFVTVQFFSAVDFWTVQNITGRLLVGLRWRTEIKEDGGENWRFESWPDERTPNSVDRSVFWIGLVLVPLVWGLFFMANTLTFSPFWVSVIQALSSFLIMALGVANFVGFWKCRKDHQHKLESLLVGKAIGLARL